MITNFDNFINIGVICEGQTEINFIKTLNKRFFNVKNISLKPIDTGRQNKSLNGNISVDRVVDFLCRSNFSKLTTFIDFYGMKNKENKTVYELEKELKYKFYEKDKQGRVFIPYIQMHEIEALWFSDINAIIKVKNATIQQTKKLNEINKYYPNPEDINDSYETAPSKRLEKIFSDYNKIIDGKLISDIIQIDVFMAMCPRFKEWINKIITIQ